MNTDSLIVCMAGINIEIYSPYRLSRTFFRHFLSDGQPDCTVMISHDDISVNKKHKKLAQETWEGSVISSNLLQKVADCLLEYNVVLMHCATIALGDNAYAFMAPSGTGKTTHILKWLNKHTDVFVINGDKPFIKFQGDEFNPLVCGSPWAGKEKMYTNTMVKLKAIIYLERAQNNSIERISFTEAIPLLLQQTYRPKDEGKMRKTLKLLQYLNGKVMFYRFQCNNFKDDCFDVAYHELVE